MLLAGCAQYSLRAVPIVANPAPLEQAKLICQSRANMVGQQAYSNVQGSYVPPPAQYNAYCSTNTNGQFYGNQYSATGNTNCSSYQTNSAQQSMAQLSNTFGAIAAEERMGRNALVACMAELGYRVERVCVANCPNQYGGYDSGVATRPAPSQQVQPQQAVTQNPQGAPFLSEACYRACFSVRQDPQACTNACTR